MDLGAGDRRDSDALIAVRAQVQAINGSVRGRVLDQTGSPLADAAVTIENAQTGFSRSLTTRKTATT